eukprot:TRINITY_DN4847_c0_g1_i1.p1 TRINITY_DN4847_c0_g1~~TRINITY_DN4847_c0_g1_i1.p1  ORF type:complete len:634 (+),score=215.69 TRINITY_DN4847_c0_g1_i1:92-1993(+)
MPDILDDDADALAGGRPYGKGDGDNFESLFAELGQIKKEDEVHLAELEGRMRQMIIDVLKPTVHRAMNLQTEFQTLSKKQDGTLTKLQEIAASVREAKERSEAVSLFQSQLETFWDKHREVEFRMEKNDKIITGRVEAMQRDFEAQKAVSIRYGRNFERNASEMGEVKKTLQELHESMEAGMQRSKEQVQDEVRRIDASVKDVSEMQRILNEEIWGSDDCQELSPVSLRRLDLQMKKANGVLAEATSDIADLRRIDGEMVNMMRQQGMLMDKLQNLTDSTTEMEQRVTNMADDSQAELKRVSNLMAAFSANLLKESRANVLEDLKAATSLREDVSEFVRQSQDAIAQLDKAVVATGNQVEALLKEIRIDMDSLDVRRKRDKAELERDVADLGTKVSAATDTAGNTYKGLQHVSGVLGMSLQSERMSVALDLQDFIERKDTPYVGVSTAEMDSEKRKTAAKKRYLAQGIAPENLVRLQYAPQALSFAGNAFERPQLLALREKLVHAAQEALLQGPAGLQSRDGSRANLRGKSVGQESAKHIPDAVAGRVLGKSADLPANLLGGSGGKTVSGPASERRPSVPRPGSQGQPSARGSPSLEADRPMTTPVGRRLPKLDGSDWKPGSEAAGLAPVSAR